VATWRALALTPTPGSRRVAVCRPLPLLTGISRSGRALNPARSVRSRIVARLSDDAAWCEEQVPDEEDERDDEEQMNERSGQVYDDESEEPEHREDDDQGPQQSDHEANPPVAEFV